MSQNLFCFMTKRCKFNHSDAVSPFFFKPRQNFKDFENIFNWYSQIDTTRTYDYNVQKAWMQHIVARLKKCITSYSMYVNVLEIVICTPEHVKKDVVPILSSDYIIHSPMHYSLMVKYSNIFKYTYIISKRFSNAIQQWFHDILLQKYAVCKTSKDYSFALNDYLKKHYFLPYTSLCNRMIFGKYYIKAVMTSEENKKRCMFSLEMTNKYITCKLCECVIKYVLMSQNNKIYCSICKDEM